MVKYLAFDVEVFLRYCCVVFVDIETLETKIFHKAVDDKANVIFDTTNEIAEYIKSSTLVGYNSDHYDDYILTCMLNGETTIRIKGVSDSIMRNQKPSFEIHQLINSIDCFRQIDLSMPSLKTIEANMGRAIVESGVDFNISRALTSKEILEVIKYCTYDTLTTVEVFKQRKYNYFDVKELLINKVNLDKQAYKWNTTTIAASLLTQGQELPKWNNLYLGDKHNELLEIVPKQVKDMWFNHRQNDAKGKVTIEEAGAVIEFGFGGLHAVNKCNQTRFENVKLLDVSSMYPNIILQINALGKASSTYLDILNKRLEAKGQDELLSDALKLVINSSYGLLNNQYSKLYNPLAAISVCMFGQIILYDLGKRLFDVGCTVFNWNTDGVYFTSDNDDYLHVKEDWENDYNLKLDLEEYDLFIQKDVNNLIAVQGGKIKTKGSQVGKYNKINYFRNGSNRVVDIAVVEYLIKGIPVIETVTNNLHNIDLYQIILRAGRTFKGTFDENGKEYQKTNRVFANTQGVKLFKQKEDGSRVNYANTPDKMLIFNNDLKYFNKHDEIDVLYYVNLAHNVLKQWI